MRMEWHKCKVDLPNAATEGLGAVIGPADAQNVHFLTKVRTGSDLRWSLAEVDAALC